jgi:hypothetical protein
MSWGFWLASVGHGREGGPSGPSLKRTTGTAGDEEVRLAERTSSEALVHGGVDLGKNRTTMVSHKTEVEEGGKGARDHR